MPRCQQKPSFLLLYGEQDWVIRAHTCPRKVLDFLVGPETSALRFSTAVDWQPGLVMPIGTVRVIVELGGLLWVLLTSDPGSYRRKHGSGR